MDFSTFFWRLNRRWRHQRTNIAIWAFFGSFVAFIIFVLYLFDVFSGRRFEIILGCLGLFNFSLFVLTNWLAGYVRFYLLTNLNLIFGMFFLLKRITGF
jgi:hypothetical protein